MPCWSKVENLRVGFKVLMTPDPRTLGGDGCGIYPPHKLKSSRPVLLPFVLVDLSGAQKAWLELVVPVPNLGSEPR